MVAVAVMVCLFLLDIFCRCLVDKSCPSLADMDRYFQSGFWVV